MKNQEDENHHGEPKLFWFTKFLELGRLPIIRQLGLLISLIFVKVAPEIPVSLRKSYTGPDGLRAGIIGFSIAIFFTLVLNIIITGVNGTLYNGTLFSGWTVHEIGQTNYSVMYFLDDWWNLVIYILVCPTYVGATCWLVVLVVNHWGEINEFRVIEVSQNSSMAKKKPFSMLKSIALGLLVMSVAFLLTTNYINDVVKLRESNQHYWFTTNVSQDTLEEQIIDNGDGIENLTVYYDLRAPGVYYFLLNFCLLMVTLIALTFFMSIYKLVLGIGKALESRNVIEGLEFEILKSKLYTFTEAYLVTKVIIACYVVNIYIWAGSPLGKGVTENFEIAIILLAIIGVFLVSFPRYYVELQWYKLKLRSKEGVELDLRYEDLRTFRIKNYAHLLDYFLLGGFLFSAINYLIGL